MRASCVISGLTASVLAFLSIVSTQAMTGKGSNLGLFLGYTLGWFVLFGFSAGLPDMLAPSEKRLLRRNRL